MVLYVSSGHQMTRTQEKHIWKSRNSASKMLYLLNRYLPCAVTLFMSYCTFESVINTWIHLYLLLLAACLVADASDTIVRSLYSSYRHWRIQTEILFIVLFASGTSGCVQVHCFAWFTDFVIFMSTWFSLACNSISMCTR